ncbi:hypothetical protein [Aureimonas glaciei]|uniref:Uncharacterized protein n=1 Tax=Aureimonas glaciei TaxID=1776957 RepID=A0A916Y1S8_9HYPH|nr:hypothetical protein [Aureimonas glaciei]GGD25994.1 hypothetical protein GCM10011335_31260 [Aureimonas glaciei]
MNNSLTTEREGPLSPAERQARRRIRRAEERAIQEALEAQAEAERIVAEEVERVRVDQAKHDQEMTLHVAATLADVLCHPKYSPSRKVQNEAFEEIRRRLEETMSEEEVEERLRSRFAIIKADRIRRRTATESGSNGHAGSTPSDTCVTPQVRIAVTSQRIADPSRDGHDGALDDGTLGGTVTTPSATSQASVGTPAFLRSPANQNGDGDDEEGGLADYLAGEAWRAHDPDPDYERMIAEELGADRNGYIR